VDFDFGHFGRQKFTGEKNHFQKIMFEIEMLQDDLEDGSDREELQSSQSWGQNT